MRAVVVIWCILASSTWAYGEALLKIPARVNVYPLYFSNTNNFESVRKDYTDSGMGAGFDLEYPVRELHVMAGITGFITLSKEEENQNGALSMISPYVGLTFKSFDVYVGYGIGSMSLDQKETYADPDDSVSYKAAMKGGVFGIRKYSQPLGPFAVGMGFNVYYMGGTSFKKSATAGGITTDSDIEKESSSYGATVQIILSMGNVGDTKGGKK